MLSVYRQMVEYRRDERAKCERGLSPRALSRLTRTVDDRRAWNDAYRSAVRIGTYRRVETHPVFAALSPAARAVIAGNAAYPSAASVMEREG